MSTWRSFHRKSCRLTQIYIKVYYKAFPGIIIYFTEELHLTIKNEFLKNARFPLNIKDSKFTIWMLASSVKS